MKKTVTLLLIFVLLTSFAACGSNANQSGNTPPATTPTQPPSGSTATPPTEPPAVPPELPTGPDGQEYGGVLRIASSATLQEPFGVPWLHVSMNRPFAPFGEALLLESTFGEIIPWLVTSWEPDWEKAEIRFQLRDDVYFQDGTKFNAETVAWNMNKWREEGLLDPSVLGAEVRGEYEVATLLSFYSNWVPNLFASRLYCFISVEHYEKNGGEYAAEHPVGTGPFVMTERVPGSHVTFARNESYWKPGMPYLDGVKYIAMTDAMTQTAALMAPGDDGIDAVATSSGELIMSFADNPNVYVKSAPTGPISLMPSSIDESSPLSIREVRQAISYAIDRQAICDARGFGIWTPGNQIIAPGFVGRLPDSFNLSYDPDQAKALLAEAGYPDGFGTTLYSPGAVDRDAMVAVQAMLRDVGIDAALEFPEAGAATDLRTKGWAGLYAATVSGFPNMSSTWGLYFDPDYIYYPKMWRPDNIAGMYKDSRTSAQVEPKLMELYHQALMENQICIPMYNIYNSYIIRNNFHDTGFTEWGSGTQWLPWDAWMSSH